MCNMKRSAKNNYSSALMNFKLFTQKDTSERFSALHNIHEMCEQVNVSRSLCYSILKQGTMAPKN